MLDRLVTPTDARAPRTYGISLVGPHTRAFEAEHKNNRQCAVRDSGSGAPQAATTPRTDLLPIRRGPHDLWLVSRQVSTYAC